MAANKRLVTAGLAVFAVLGLGTAAIEWRARQIRRPATAAAAARPPTPEVRLRAATARISELEQQLENARAATEAAAAAAEAAAADLAERQSMSMRPEAAAPPTAALFNWGPVLAKLNLEPDKRASVARYLANFETGPGGTDWNRLFHTYSPASAAESQAILEAFRIDFGTALKGLVGDEGYGEIVQYRHTPEVQFRQLATQVRNQSGEPLSDADGERLISVVLANAETAPGTGDPNRFNTLYDLAAIRVQAAPFLSATQLNILTTQIADRSNASFAPSAAMAKQGEIMTKARARLQATPAR